MKKLFDWSLILFLNVYILVMLDNTDFINFLLCIRSRQDVFLHLAEKIPQLKSRVNPRPSPDSQPQGGKSGRNKKKK